METIVQFLVHITDANLSPEQKASQATEMLKALRQLGGASIRQLRYYETPGNTDTAPNPSRTGVRFAIDGDRVRGVLEQLCDRISAYPMELQVLLHNRRTTLQIRTASAEELASIISSAEYLLPPRQTFLAKAEQYARSRGEFSPAEVANLEWLQFQLELDPEDAQWFMNKALGPYRSREAKRQHYEAVLAQELQRESPLSEATQQTLWELAQNLPLPEADRQEINQRLLIQRSIDAEADRQREAEATERARREEATRLQLEAEQQIEQEHQHRRQTYQQAYGHAIADSPFPLVFDRGRLEQMREMWEIPPEEARQLEAAEAAHRYGDITSAIGADYSRLRLLLWQGSWQEADRELERVLLGRLSTDMQPLTAEQMEQFPCQDLASLDRLWSRYSNNRFGFSTQLQIFLDVNGANEQPDSFARQVEWGRSLPLTDVDYTQLQFDPDAPRGHLPTWRWSCLHLEGGYRIEEELMRRFFARLRGCLSDMSAADVAA